ncbi:MAG: Gfo/Idh/MocA family oxidoreductase [Anaerolineales bacterium]|nr:Gfo/Idh/MocA family oxidoreductase [Anaerolineales bacterium]
MRFLISGLGSIGRRHLRNLITLGQKDIVLHRSGKSTLPLEELEGFPVEQDLLEALVNQRPDAVIVSNPTAHHLEVAIPAAKAGCSILLEKPVSNSLDRVEEFRSALVEGGGQVLVGFQFRFHPGLRRIRSLLEAGAIGRPLSARVQWGEYLPAWHPWEDYQLSYSARSDLGGGVLLTLCHPFDYLRWLFGEVESVFATIDTIGDLDIEVEDTADVLMRFEAGMMGNVHVDYNQRPPSHWLEIVGTHGTIGWDNATGEVRWWTSKDKNWKSFSPPEAFERNTMFHDEMQHFLTVVQGDALPVCALDDGVQALRIVLAAKESARQTKKIELANLGTGS